MRPWPPTPERCIDADAARGSPGDGVSTPVAVTHYRFPLSHEALVVCFLTEHGRVTSYAVVLLVREQGHLEPVRVYDNAHGQNDMHRHTRAGGKQAAERFSESPSGEAMRAARAAILDGYDNMIQAWRR